jgi:hypothetical protein
MQITAAKTISAIAIAGVAVLGAQYAGAAPAHHAASSSTAKSADPDIAPIRNIAHVYSVSTSGGTGQVSYSITNPPAGIYAASFTANFYPQGSPAAPETFSCYLLKDGAMRAQSVATGTYTSGFYLGVNGSNTVKVTSGSVFTVGCGLADGGAWTWGTQPLQVTMTRVDGLSLHSLAKQAGKTLMPVATTR